MADSTIRMREEFNIEGITSVHHFEYRSDFIFKSEYHDYWTLFFVEEGIFELSHPGRKEEAAELARDHLYLQAPEENYSFRSLGGVPARVFTMGFYCNDANLDLLANRDQLCDEYLKSLMESIARESSLCFTSRVDGSSRYYLERKYNQPFGGEQLITLWMKSLFIALIRRQLQEGRLEVPIYDSDSLKRDILMFERITNYYMDHITEHLKIEKVCQDLSIGRSHLQRIFRKQADMGAIEYFCQMRISVARDYIRDKEMNLTDTAQALGYSSVQYFSKQFKKYTGMTPSEYKNSIKAARNDPVYRHIHPE